MDMIIIGTETKLTIQSPLSVWCPFVDRFAVTFSVIYMDFFVVVVRGALNNFTVYLSYTPVYCSVIGKNE